MEKRRVLFVCTGNICRSPTAHAVMAKLVKDSNLAHCIEIDSAGISGAHAGEKPDKRSQEAAKKRGYDLSKIRARKVTEDDLIQFDYVIAMDTGHLHYLENLAAKIAEKEISLEHVKAKRAQLSLLLAHKPELQKQDVADPYYGPINGFDRVLDDIEQGCVALLRQWQNTTAKTN